MQTLHTTDTILKLIERRNDDRDKIVNIRMCNVVDLVAQNVRRFTRGRTKSSTVAEAVNHAFTSVVHMHPTLSGEPIDGGECTVNDLWILMVSNMALLCFPSPLKQQQ